MEYLHLTMVRDDLAAIPQFELPSPFTVRPYRPGDAETWRHIHLLADRFGTYPPEKFWERFCRDESVLAERQLYLCDEASEAVGTMTAWYGESEEWRGWGRVHYVAVVPAMQGRGLSKPLLTLTLNRLRELGHERAFLGTQTVRPVAINLYLRFGFLPLVRNDEDIRAWRVVATRLKPAYWQRAIEQVVELH
ncbi:MAG: GNAT family N-acetyltransferase [Planctomycetota bacterium]